MPDVKVLRDAGECNAHNCSSKIKMGNSQVSNRKEIPLVVCKERLLSRPSIVVCLSLTVELMPFQYGQVRSMEKLEQVIIVDLAVVKSIGRFCQNGLPAEFPKHLVLPFVCAIMK